MEMTRKQKVVILSVFLSVVLLSFTVLQYIGSSRYWKETYKTVGQQHQSLPLVRTLRETTSDSLSGDSGQVTAVTIESCLGVEEPAEENVR